MDQGSLVDIGPSFPNLFKENWDLFCKVGALEAKNSPVAYLSSLYRFALEELEGPNPDNNRITLENRRPDLKDLLIDHQSTFTPIPALKIVNQVLTKAIQAHEPDNQTPLFQRLAARHHPFQFPYNFHHQQISLGLVDKKPGLGELSYRISLEVPATTTLNTYGAVQQPNDVAQMAMSGLSPEQQAILLAPPLPEPAPPGAGTALSGSQHIGDDSPQVLQELNQGNDPVQAVGLANITRKNPDFGGTLAVALSSSRKGLAFARQKINQALLPFAPNSDRQILMSYFRDGPEISHGEDTLILKMLSTRIVTLSKFLETWDSARIVGVGGDKNSRHVAWQYTNDSDHHLFMRDSVAHESAHVAAWNIIHETSHMILGTQDYWYMSTPGATPKGATGLASYGGKIDVLAHLQRFERRFENIIWDGPDAADLEQAAFPGPLARARTLMNNADSISLATAFINQRFNGPMASLSMINKTVSGIPALDLASNQDRSFNKQRRLSL